MQEEPNRFFFYINMYSVSVVNKIRKKYNNSNYIEISLINYEGLNYYIRIDKDKDIYYLSYYDLNINNKFNKKYINKIILSNSSYTFIEDILRNQSNIYDNKKSNDANIQSDVEVVHFKAKFDTNEYNYIFQTFIPLNLIFLVDIFYVIFSNLPHRLFPIFEELIAKLNKNEGKYMYKKSFKFDLLRGKLNTIFNPTIIERGEYYYKNKNVRFLELINSSYYSIVESENGIYTIIIDYDKKDKMVKLSCTCPCEFYCKHMYATILQIRNKEFFKYYKVRYLAENNDYFHKLFSLNYFLCIGVDGDNIVLVYPNGEIHLLPIYDSNGYPMFEVVEDDENLYLTNYINNKRN